MSARRTRVRGTPTATLLLSDPKQNTSLRYFSEAVPGPILEAPSVHREHEVSRPLPEAATSHNRRAWVISGQDLVMSRTTRSQGFPRALALVAVFVCASAALADKSPYEWAFVRLDYARREKVRQFKRFCDQVHEAAAQAATDPALLDFFDVNRKYFNLKQAGHDAPEELDRQIATFRQAITDHYLRNYLCFYDILMIDATGNIFYTVRKEADFQHNLFQGRCADCPLAQHLQTTPQEETFLDFHYYIASDEPAAFFVEPLHKDGQLIGWLVLQYAINKVNSLFAGVEKLGATG